MSASVVFRASDPSSNAPTALRGRCSQAIERSLRHRGANMLGRDATHWAFAKARHQLERLLAVLRLAARRPALLVIGTCG